MKICCNQKLCTQSPEFTCKCQKNLYFCSDHRSLHVQMNCGYTTEFTFLDISSSDRIKSLKNIDKDIQTLKNAKKLTISRSSLLIETIQSSVKNYLNHINEKIDHYTYLKNKVTNVSRIVKSDEILLSDFMYEINDKQEDIENFLNYNIGEHILKTRYDSGFDSQATLFWMAQNYLTVLNLQSFKTTTHNMQIYLNYIHVCQISETNYFVSAANQPQCFNFNLTRKIFKPLPNGLEINNFGATVFLKDNIYRFGGDRVVHDKFNILTNIWQSIPKSPMTSTLNLTGSSVNGSIFLAGYNDNKIYSFDPVTEKYLALFTVPPNNIRHLAKNYLISQEKLYVQEGLNTKKWVGHDYESREEFGNTLLNSLLIVRGTDVYFILDTHKLIKVDTKQKKIYYVGFV